MGPSVVEREAIERARVARLATTDADGNPHVVPVCYAVRWDADAEIVTPIDEKPKSVDAVAMRRVRDIELNPRVALVIDEYVDSWSELYWVQLRGTARIWSPGSPGHDEAVTALRAKYRQYADHALEDRPMIAIAIGHVLSWGLESPDGPDLG